MAEKKEKKITALVVFDTIAHLFGFIVLAVIIGGVIYGCAKPTYDPDDYNKDGVVDGTDAELYENTRQQVEDAIEDGVLEEDQ